MLIVGNFTLTISQAGQLQWYRNPTVVGVIIGGLLTLFVQSVIQLLTHNFTRQRESRTRIVNAHAKLAALASNDLERARNVEALVALSRPQEGDESFEGWCAEISKLGRRRDRLRERLTAARFQCLLYEGNKQLRDAIEHLAKEQPFIIPLGTWSSPDYQERLKEYKVKVDTYEAALHALCNAVLAHYSNG